MRVLNKTTDVPKHYERLWGEVVEETESKILFEFAEGCRRWLKVENLMAVDLGYYRNRVYYINKYKMPRK